MPHRRARSLEVFTLIAGVVLSLGGALVTFIWPQSDAVNIALLTALIGISISVGLGQRVATSELMEAVEKNGRDVEILRRIMRRGKTDEMIIERYERLRQEIADLAEGRYYIRSLPALYIDNIRQMRILHRGERLLSTCPVTIVSLELAEQQLRDVHYLASMEAHEAAANRGVKVTRIYLFKNREFLELGSIRSHIEELQKSRMEVRVCFRDEAKIEGDYDFLVFGERKVSVGSVDPDTGMVSGAVVYSDPSIVGSYIRQYEQLRILSSLKLDVQPKKPGSGSIP